MKTPQEQAEESIRADFEQWAVSPPFELCLDRHPKDEANYAWPGQYVNYQVELAWCAWRDAKESIPLPELIAVAQAAQHNPNCSSGYNLQCDCNHRNLKQALQALRATGKVEL